MLQDYPRPPKDTGRGFHDSAGCDRKPPDLRGYARYLRQELGITWYKALVGGQNKTDLARVFTQEGIEVIVRLYSPQPHPGYVVSVADVAAYVQAGVHYFEWGNEPNLVAEWNRASWDEGARVDKVCEQFLRNADAIRQGGGIPLLPALSPGGDYPHRDWYRTMFEWFRLHGHLADLEGAGLAIHNRPFKHAPSYRDKPGEPAPGCHFLDYEWIDDLVRAYVGHSLSLLGTEAGYEPEWLGGNLQTHAAANLDILRGFREGRWRDALFCECMWLVDAFGHRPFSEAAWHHNHRWAGGGNLPAVDALRHEWATRPFERHFAWETVPVPPPQAIYPCSDRAGMPITAVVWHGAEGRRVADYLRTQTNKSAHYAIEADGTVTAMVPEQMAAWHCARSSIPGIPYGSVNGTDTANVGSIGVEMACDPAPATPGWTEAQIEAAVKLGRELSVRYQLAPGQHYRHSDVDPTKRDPREFPWERLLDAIYEPVTPPGEKEEDVEELIRKAAWKLVGVPWNALAAFPRVARENDLGAPLGVETDVTVEGVTHRWQPFSKGIVAAKVGAWHDCKVLKW